MKHSDIVSRYLLRVEGPVFMVVFALSTVLLIRDMLRRRNIQDFIVFSTAVLPLVVFSFYRYRGYFPSRTISIAVPFMAIAMGRCVARVNRQLYFYAFLIIVSLGYCRSSHIPRVSSGYREAAQYITSKGYEKVFILSNEPVFRAYGGRMAYRPYDRPKSIGELCQLSDETGIDRVVVDFNVLHSMYGQGYVTSIVQEVEPEVTFDNPVGGSFVHLSEIYPQEIIEKILLDPDARRIGIYDMNQYRNRGK